VTIPQGHVDVLVAQDPLELEKVSTVLHPQRRKGVTQVVIRQTAIRMVSVRQEHVAPTALRLGKHATYCPYVEVFCLLSTVPRPAS
jgi:hypothetical protein